MIVKREVIIENAQPYTAETTALRTTEINYSSVYPADHVVVEERTTIRDAGGNNNPAAFDPDYIEEDLYDPYYYDGDYLGAELQIGFNSYAASLNPETIWISYSGLDMIW